MKKKLFRFLAYAALLVVLVAAAFVVGSVYRVSTATAWEKFSSSDGEWAGVFPAKPVMFAGEAPAPFVGGLKTWASKTARASYEVTELGPQPEGKSAPGATPFLLAAAAANALGGKLELTGTGGEFRIRTERAGTVYGKVITAPGGRVYRLLAASAADREGAGPGPDAKLFFNEFRVRGQSRQQPAEH